jgi:putative transposase
VTQFRTGEGWLYLAAVLDLWSRRVIGWAMGSAISAELVAAQIVQIWLAATGLAPDRRCLE